MSVSRGCDKLKGRVPVCEAVAHCGTNWESRKFCEEGKFKFSMLSRCVTMFRYAASLRGRRVFSLREGTKGRASSRLERLGRFLSISRLHLAKDSRNCSSKPCVFYFVFFCLFLVFDASSTSTSSAFRFSSSPSLHTLPVPILSPFSHQSLPCHNTLGIKPPSSWNFLRLSLLIVVPWRAGLGEL